MCVCVSTSLYVFTCMYVYMYVCMYVCSCRETLSRSLLLVVSLGYGIVRPKLMTTEWVAIAVVSMLYFITGTRRTYTSTHTYINTYSTYFFPYVYTYLHTYLHGKGRSLRFKDPTLNTYYHIHTYIHTYMHTYIHSII